MRECFSHARYGRPPFWSKCWLAGVAMPLRGGALTVAEALLKFTLAARAQLESGNETALVQSAIGDLKGLNHRLTDQRAGRSGKA